MTIDWKKIGIIAGVAAGALVLGAVVVKIAPMGVTIAAAISGVVSFAGGCIASAWWFKKNPDKL